MRHVRHAPSRAAEREEREEPAGRTFLPHHSITLAGVIWKTRRLPWGDTHTRVRVRARVRVRVRVRVRACVPQRPRRLSVISDQQIIGPS